MAPSARQGGDGFGLSRRWKKEIEKDGTTTTTMITMATSSATPKKEDDDNDSNNEEDRVDATTNTANNNKKRKREVPQWKDAVAGACAGAFSRTAMAPVERIKLLSK